MWMNVFPRRALTLWTVTTEAVDFVVYPTHVQLVEKCFSAGIKGGMLRDPSCPSEGRWGVQHTRLHNGFAWSFGFHGHLSACNVNELPDHASTLGYKIILQCKMRSSFVCWRFVNTHFPVNGVLTIDQLYRAKQRCISAIRGCVIITIFSASKSEISSEA